LTVVPDTLGEDFEVSAWTDQDECMAIRHRHAPLEGVQFHPESFLTTEGTRLLTNFLNL
jgi:anthranilate/para-aminobenzoate synthase component II